MKSSHSRLPVLFLALALFSLPLARPLGAQPGKIAASAGEVAPLREGSKVPDVNLRTLKGHEVSLRSLVAEKPTVLVFYRGGWCPHCNRHLSGLKDVEKELAGMGYRLLAVSPDNAKHLRETLGKNDLSYTLLSDSSMEAAKAFGLAFKVDAETVKRYEKWNIDLVKSSGRKHHLLPVPAAYVIKKGGRIAFAYWDADYKTRIDPRALLEAAKKAK